MVREPRTPIVPIYLNHEYVFDLLAMLKGGLATVTQIEKSDTEERSRDAELNAGSGSGGLLNGLFKVDLAATVAGSKSAGNEVRSSETRTHSPASLLFDLISELEANEQISGGASDEVAFGDFVMFQCRLDKDPLSTSLESILRMMNLASSFDEPQNKSQKGKQRRNEPSLAEQISAQLQPIINDLRSGGTIDLVGNTIDGELNVLVTVNVEFLDEIAMATLVDGVFYVFGKCINVIGGEDSDLSLIRKSSMRLAPNVIQAMLSTYDDLNASPDISIDKPKISVPGPAVHVLPVAVFA